MDEGDHMGLSRREWLGRVAGAAAGASLFGALTNRAVGVASPPGAPSNHELSRRATAYLARLQKCGKHEVCFPRHELMWDMGLGNDCTNASPFSSVRTLSFRTSSVE